MNVETSPAHLLLFFILTTIFCYIYFALNKQLKASNKSRFLKARVHYTRYTQFKLNCKEFYDESFQNTYGFWFEKCVKLDNLMGQPADYKQCDDDHSHPSDLRDEI